MGLNILRSKLLYASLLDTWMALCEEKGWEWFDIKGYEALLEFLNREKITLNEIPVCVEETGRKAAFVKKFSKETGKTFKVHTLRLEDNTVAKLRTFQKPD